MIANMHKYFRLAVMALLLQTASSFAMTNRCSAASGNEPGWTHGVLLFGEEKAKKDATPILERNYRPLHFYGNTIRRQYYRGTAVPSVGDGLQAAKVVVTRQ